jgi:transposase
VLAVGAVPNVGVAVLAARDDSAAVGSNEDLLDDAVGALGRQCLSGGRVPAVDGSINGTGQRFPSVREVKVAGSSVNAQPFDFTSDYTADGPARFLAGYKGYFQADALAQYEGLYGDDKVKHVCCVAHARRKFVAASDAGDERASKALEMIGRLYAIERALPPLLPPSDALGQREQRRQREEQRRQLRQRDAEPVWAELSKWLGEQKPGVLPKSPLGTAIGYASNNWDALRRCLEQGFLALDNNLSERTLRAVALGRNAWGVIGSEVGGTTAAVLYSVVGTCKHLGIDPFAYLRDTLPGLFALGEKPTTEQLLDWLPDHWPLNRTQGQPIREVAAG